MKTPREILLKRHEAANDKLDAVQKNAMAEAFPPERRVSGHRPTRTFDFGWLQGLFQFTPRTWAALTAVWILIFALKLSTRQETHVVSTKSRQSGEMTAAVRDQRLFYAELIGLRQPEQADRPKTFAPGPRSELRLANSLA